MSELRDDVLKIIEGAAAWLIDRPGREDITDAMVTLFERTCVERERAAFVAGVRWTCGSQHTGDENFVDEAARRYPMPEEG